LLRWKELARAVVRVGAGVPLAGRLLRRRSAADPSAGVSGSLIPRLDVMEIEDERRNDMLLVRRISLVAVLCLLRR
jgi:hypothetical protein